MDNEYAKLIKTLNAELAASFTAQKRQLNIIGALARIYLHSIYIDLAAGAFEEITGAQYVSDAIGKQGDARRAAEIIVEMMVTPKSQETMRQFLDLATLKQRLGDLPSISTDYISTYIGWCRANFFVAERTWDGAPSGVIYAVQSIADEKRRENELLSRLNNYSQKVYLDSLTGAYNRRYFTENKVSLSRFFAVAMIDIDDFKATNDKFGVKAGDVVLSEVVDFINSRLRSYDVLIRYSEDEFIVAFLTGPDHEVVKILEAVQVGVGTMEFPPYPQIQVTVSVGCAFRATAADMFLMADKMLYRAKRTKNCVAM